MTIVPWPPRGAVVSLVTIVPGRLSAVDAVAVPSRLGWISRGRSMPLPLGFTQGRLDSA